MTTYISMLRGINVGRHKKVKMKDLKDLYQSLNLNDVKTYIQSGNVVFQSPDSTPSKLKEEIENKIKEVFGFDVPVFIRSKEEFQKIIEDNPFKKEDIKHLHVTFLSDPLTEKPVKEKLIQEINKIKDKSEDLSISDDEIYLYLPNGYGRTKLSNDFFEKKLKVSATTRNWRTVNKLLDIAK
jgi:uncharacterized protein (DUF1697 family)